ncbi:hypothetical protein MMC16_006713 [Acarospora aff. strigata]|nr:hypothetical protein [Acarospora aff. strigata]
MKPTALLALFLSAMAVTAAPMADAAAVADLDVASAPVSLEARDLTKGQCKNACDRGADAVERFCRLIPEPRIRAACWGAAAAVQTPIGQRACTAFCDAFF